MRTPRLFVAVSVDWEPNHGRWAQGRETDYGGILTATPAFQELLDCARVPCTWFVESAAEPDRDLPRLFPETLAQIASRRADEIGLHVHWRRPNGADGNVAYETTDRGWTARQVAHGVSRLAELGIRPASFRSGALLFVDGLPAMLESFSFTVDSSTLWTGANRLSAGGNAGRRVAARRAVDLLRRLQAGPRDPYRPDCEDVEREGRSSLVEFPIWAALVESRDLSFNAARAAALRFAARRARPTFLTLFFHIDELLEAGSGMNERARVSADALRLLDRRIRALSARPGTCFVTLSRAREIFLQETA